MNRSTLVLAASLTLAITAPAQVTYVDAADGVNTTLADGSPFFPNPVTSGSDDNWSIRAFANGATIYESNGQTVTGFEDAPMLRTTITGLIPGLPYIVYGYFWSDNGTGTCWRGRALVSQTVPSPDLPGYNTRHFASSVFAPMRPLALGAALGTAGFPGLDLALDANNNEASGHFTNTVLLAEGNRWLYQAPLGVHAADANGELWVFVDDLANTTTGNRTWYDGVGYEIAPFRFGTGCGVPSAPTIGFSGVPVINDDFAVELSGAAPGTACALLIGSSSSNWNGVPLPFDLSTLGFPGGCLLNVSPDVAAPGLTDASGQAALPLTIRGDFTATVYWQWLVLGQGPAFGVTGGLSTLIHR
jgi:hypothetical protein